jgi:hypothetical protein
MGARLRQPQRRLKALCGVRCFHERVGAAEGAGTGAGLAVGDAEAEAEGAGTGAGLAVGDAEAEGAGIGAGLAVGDAEGVGATGAGCAPEGTGTGTGAADRRGVGTGTGAADRDPVDDVGDGLGVAGPASAPIASDLAVSELTAPWSDAARATLTPPTTMTTAAGAATHHCLRDNDPIRNLRFWLTEMPAPVSTAGQTRRLHSRHGKSKQSPATETAADSDSSRSCTDSPGDKCPVIPRSADYGAEGDSVA